MGRPKESDVHVSFRPSYILPADNSSSVHFVDFHVSLAKIQLLSLQLPSLNRVSAKDLELSHSGYLALYCFLLLSSSMS